MKTVLTIGVALVLTLGGSGTASAGFCLDALSFCNDIKLEVDEVQGEIVELFGYEYGCGFPNRQLSGSGRMVGDVLHIGLTGSYNDSWMAAIHVPVNTSTLAGVGSFTFVSAGYINTPAAFQAIQCPVLPATSFEPDASQ
jgi:hypothetical protein